MNDPLGTFLGEDLCHGLTIGDILLDELEAVAVGELFEPGVFELNVIIVVEIVEAGDFMTLIEQHPAGMEADKSRCAGDQYAH
jgi:hypothetical protein